MNRLLAFFGVIFTRWGFVTFTVFYALFFLSFLNVVPMPLLNGLAALMNPYYEPLRMASFISHVVIFVVSVQLFYRFVAYKRFILKRKLLSLLYALGALQLVSFFCYANLPAALLYLNEQSTYYTLYHTYGGYTVELVALCLTGYLLAFYTGGLSHRKFKIDIAFTLKKNPGFDEKK